MSHTVSNHQTPIAAMTLGLFAAIGTQAFRLNCQWDTWIVWAELAVAGLLLGLILSLGHHRRHTTKIQSQAYEGGQKLAFVCFLLLIFLPILVQILANPYNMGDPGEVVMLSILQNAALGLIAIGSQPRWILISIIFSSFQLLFVGFVYPIWLTYLLCGLGTFVVLWWMMGNYWGRVAAHSASRVQTKIPMRGFVFIATSLLLLGAVVLAVTFAPQRAVAILQGFMPTSGGEWWGSQFARNGLGNGEVLTGATDQADTIGPVDSEVYLSSQRPSLYDMLSLVYGKPNKHNERRVDVSGNEIKEHGHERMQETKASREFSTSRQTRPRDRELERRKSDALLFVKGSVPLHIRLESYDQFDGVTWTQSETIPPITLEMVQRGNNHWTRRSEWPTPDYMIGSNWHQVCVVNLQTLAIPSPHLLNEWHIPKVDDVTFFSWTAGDTPCMTGRERIAALTTIDFKSHVPNIYQLKQIEVTDTDKLPETYTGLAATAREAIVTKLPQQIRGRDWQAVEQIETYLRQNYVFDPALQIDEDETDTVSLFLEHKRGPDYLFATTAVCWLRSLGISARLVQGFYAAPQNYEPDVRQTIVWPDDVHTWCEVCLDGYNWIPLEPTPSYALPQRELTRTQWFTMAAWNVWQWVLKNLFALVMGATVLVLACIFRFHLLDITCRNGWPLLAWLPAKMQVQVCVSLLEWRATMAGKRRPKTETLKSWFRRMVIVPNHDLQQQEQALLQTFSWLDQILYAGHRLDHNHRRQSIHDTCRLALAYPIHKSNRRFSSTQRKTHNQK